MHTLYRQEDEFNRVHTPYFYKGAWERVYNTSPEKICKRQDSEEGFE